MSDNPISRRDLLRGMTVAGGGLALLGGLPFLSRLARASSAAASDRHYIFCYFAGGWDVLLGLDPRDPAEFDLRRMPISQIYPGYELLQGIADAGLVETQTPGMTFGPFIGDLASYHDRLAVVRGMSMDTLTHESGMRRFLTGKPPIGTAARGSAGGTWLASKLGAQDPIPNLSVGVESYNAEQPNYATAFKAGSVNDLVRALRPADPPLDDRTRRQIEAMLGDASRCELGQRSRLWQVAQAAREATNQQVAAKLDSLFDFQAKNAEMERIRGHYGIAATGAAALKTSEAQAAAAAQAIKNEVSRCVSFNAAVSLDTHFVNWTTDQGPNQQRGFNVVARLIEDLEATQYKDTGDTWLDHTIIVGFSEFTRSPLINVYNGRDHWLMNACFLIGGNIKGGQVIGASSDVGMAPQPINLQTGQVDLGGGQIPKPEHILRTLLVDAGVSADEADLRVEPIRRLLKS